MTKFVSSGLTFCFFKSFLDIISISVNGVTTLIVLLRVFQIYQKDVRESNDLLPLLNSRLLEGLEKHDDTYVVDVGLSVPTFRVNVFPIKPVQ